MEFPRRSRLGSLVLMGAMVLAMGCGGDGGASETDGGSGGGAATGGGTGSGGATGTGGATASGGANASGGGTGTGTGGQMGDAGVPATGGSPATGSGGAAGGGGQSGSGGAAGATASARLVGRIDSSDAARPSFSWSGSAVVARFQGTGASLRIDGSPNQYTVVVDGTVATQVLKVVSGTAQYTVASGLPAGTHDVVVWKRTEGNLGANRFLGVDVTGGQLVDPPAAPDRRLEIYGDSITAGYGMDGAGPTCTASADNENHYNTYAAVTARELKAELHAVAWSGIGMYRNYGVAGASADAMPAVYARTLAAQATSAWNFATWQPHAVVINLGTNDTSTSGDPGAPFETAYLGFVRMLRQKYATAHIVLTIGPMLDGANLTAMRGHLQKVISTRSSEGDTKMSYLEFPVQQQADGLGCDYHPSKNTNAKMAALLTAELKTRLGW